MQTPYGLLFANREWILNGEETSFYHLRKILKPISVLCRMTTLYESLRWSVSTMQLLKTIKPITHVWSDQQLHIRWPPSLIGGGPMDDGEDFFGQPEFSNALHITHCRPSDHIDVIAVASTLCAIDDNEDEGYKSFKKRLRINSADWKSDYVDLVDVLKEICEICK
ncbi:hypothetical protein DdX_22409 [Ditylenchus destructor]|uniref:Uncharacterized protein n=1 Tax=Ditylenchus destructor TaxID=166010 RepID=A0AAD4MDM1_9BILA|nr:hypothetical protein DdX_22409 [Ditylenchus destructor]